MADVTLEDPLGRAIVLHDRTWYGHILKVHPEMAPHRLLVEEAIGHPDEVRYSISDADCRIYFGSGPQPAIITMVVADVVLGLVKTAHLARNASGGSQEWSK